MRVQELIDQLNKVKEKENSYFTTMVLELVKLKKQETKFLFIKTIIMILQEKIKERAKGYGNLALAFLEGAEFALNEQWINVKEDLPCNHEELINGNVTHSVFVRDINNMYGVSIMMKFIKWDFMSCNITHWMPIPELPKE